MERDKAALGSARHCARDVEPRRKFRAPRHEKCFYFWQFFFNAVYHRGQRLNTRLRNRFLCTRYFSLNGEEVVLYVLNNFSAAPSVKSEVVGRTDFHPPDDGIQFI